MKRKSGRVWGGNPFSCLKMFRHVLAFLANPRFSVYCKMGSMTLAKHQSGQLGGLLGSK